MKTIPLTQGYEAIVDDCDYDELAKYKWHKSTEGYAVRNHRMDKGLRCTVRMHRQILGAPEEMQVDHANGVKYDNRRCNIRVCTPSQNQANTGRHHGKCSTHKGVYKTNSRKNPFMACIRVSGRDIYLGSFPDEISAAHAYDRAAVYYFGEFAKLNFPEQKAIT